MRGTKPRVNKPEEGPGKHLAVIGLVALGIALHAGYVVHHRMNSDEPQHLHVAWSVAHGLLQYRDVFDNHSPLFSLFMAPVVGVIGERPDIVLLARLAMIPLILLTLALVWRIGTGLYSARDGLWAVAITLVVPDFMLGSVEYRTDQLWTTAWMAAMAVLLLGRATRGRSFLFGLLLGASFGASMKTSLLALSLAFGVVSAALMARGKGAGPSRKEFLSLAGAGLAGLVVVPGALAGYFASQGALPSLLYGTVGHNIVPGLGSWRAASVRALLLPLALPLLWLIGRRIAETAPDPGIGMRRAALFLTAAVYYVALLSVWPLLTRQDYLPFIPMAAIVLAPYLLWRIPERLAALRPLPVAFARMLRLAPVLVLLLVVAKAQRIEPVWADNGGRGDVAFLREVLRMTRPGELVMDLRGETIFRRRPFYYALEAVTDARIESGRIADEIAERLIQTRTPAAVADTPHFPKRARAFLAANYIQIGALRFAGEELGPSDARGTRHFEVHVPQRYALVSDHGAVAGVLDGAVYHGPRELAAGPHVFQGVPGFGRMAILWADAIARGGSPFPDRGTEADAARRRQNIELRPSSLDQEGPGVEPPQSVVNFSP